MSKRKTHSVGLYGCLDIPPLTAPPQELAEAGTVRLAQVLDVIAAALEEYPEARLAVSAAIAEKLGGGPQTKVLA